MAEISDLLRLEEGTHCAEARTLAQRKLAKVRAELIGLERLQGTLASLVRAHRTHKGALSRPLIASLHGHRSLTNVQDFL